MTGHIKDMAYYLPKCQVTNEALKEENPSWDMAYLGTRTGVLQRYVCEEKETALDLAAHACKKLLENDNDRKNLIDGLIFCTQNPDYIVPSNACVLHQMLELPEHVMAFDLNLACSGYVYGLSIAQSLIVSKAASNVLLVNADTYSKYINPRDRSARVLFGDGAAVTWVTGGDKNGGIIDIQCSTAGAHYDKFIIPAGGCRQPKNEKTSINKEDKSGNLRSLEDIHMDGMGILSFVNSKVPEQVRDILKKNNLNINDIDLYVFHQASKLALDSLERLLNLPSEKVFRNLETVGNTVSASIPMALKDALDSGKISSGSKVLVSGFGAGLSWATAILEI